MPDTKKRIEVRDAAILDPNLRSPTRTTTLRDPDGATLAFARDNGPELLRPIREAVEFALFHDTAARVHRIAPASIILLKGPMMKDKHLGRTGLQVSRLDPVQGSRRMSPHWPVSAHPSFF